MRQDDWQSPRLRGRSYFRACYQAKLITEITGKLNRLKICKNQKGKPKLNSENPHRLFQAEYRNWPSELPPFDPRTTPPPKVQVQFQQEQPAEAAAQVVLQEQPAQAVAEDQPLEEEYHPGGWYIDFGDIPEYIPTPIVEIDANRKRSIFSIPPEKPKKKKQCKSPKLKAKLLDLFGEMTFSEEE
ncbi:hypothetical protein TKK_0016589 [Trichogramma kaykai]